MKTTWPVVVLMLGLLAFLGVMFWLHILSAPALAVSVATTILGWLTQAPHSKKTGASLLPPPPFDSIAPVAIPPTKAPPEE